MQRLVHRFHDPIGGGAHPLLTGVLSGTDGLHNYAAVRTQLGAATNASDLSMIDRRQQMALEDFPAPTEGFVLTWRLPRIRTR
jgi:hypothetical protein